MEPNYDKILRYCEESEVGPFTKKLISLTKLILRREQGLTVIPNSKGAFEKWLMYFEHPYHSGRKVIQGL